MRHNQVRKNLLDVRHSLERVSVNNPVSDLRWATDKNVAVVAIVDYGIDLVPHVNLGVLMPDIRQSLAIAKSKQSAKNSVVLQPQDELVALAGSIGLRD